VYNFCVSVRFNATPAQLAQIRTAFENASQILADATNGQQRFGAITIVNDSGASQSADYWVNSGTGRAYATIGKYGVRGEHVNLFFASNFQALNGADGDAYTIAHEHAHHVFGVLDEYSGPGIPGGADCAARPDTATLNFCLMDNYFTRGGRAFGGGYTLNEFCVSGNHDPDGNTFQGQACWNTISSHPKRSATAPSGLPPDAPPPAHTLTFNTGLGGLRVMFVIDRSGSMSIEQRLVLAKQAAKLFVNFMRVGDSIGLASFECSTSVDFPLTTITGNGTKSAIKTAIDSLSAGGATNIGGGVLAGLGQITSQSDRSCNEIIVLLTDGDHNCGTAPGSTISALQDAGATVLTVGVGSGISGSGEASLQNLASQTSGKFFRVSNSFSLIGVFLQLLLESQVKSNGLLQRAPLAIQSGQVREIQVPVEMGVESAIFGIGIINPADAVTLSLRSPSGAIITASSVDPGIEFSSEPNSKAFQILAPEAGTWTIIISAGTIVNGNLEVFSSAEHDGVHFGVSLTKETLDFPEVAEVQAAPTFGGERVVNATVMGDVIRPDGSRVAITLFDNGLAIHGDMIPGDGIYSARFSQYNMSGTYTFDLTVMSSGGMTFAGEALFDFAPLNTKPVPAFTRMASATAVVGDVPVGADLSITQVASPNPVVTGSNVTYTLTVANNGPGAAANVVVTDNLPASTTFVSCSSTNGGTCSGSGNNRSITFTSLAAGASATIDLVANVDCSAPDGTVISNMATVGSSTPDPDVSNNSKTATTTASNPPPTVTEASANPSVLWPPNHKMVNVMVNYTVTDNCPLPANACVLSVTSNEPIDGTGDGDTAPDWEIIDAHNVRLRAERAGTGTGRIYTIAITCTDNVGSSSRKTVTVTVPHNR
ncbi:MAG: VWA domain-containing protein, partial [Blastocatellia bacterium]